LTHYFVQIKLNRLYKFWEIELRGTIIEEMLPLPDATQIDDELKMPLIHSLLAFFPKKELTPGWWNQYAEWFRARPHPSVNIPWTRLMELIERHEDELESTLADCQMGVGEESESDYDEGDRLDILPDFFQNKFERISILKVGNEWMLHKQHRSLYDPELIVRVAVYQMETGNDTGVTFLDLLNEYIRFAIQARVNSL
jgi:hypothetical protein